MTTEACPVCNGDGRVYRMTAPYRSLVTEAAGGSFSWAGQTHEWGACKPCGGTGLLGAAATLDVGRLARALSPIYYAFVKPHGHAGTAIDANDAAAAIAAEYAKEERWTTEAGREMTARELVEAFERESGIEKGGTILVSPPYPGIVPTWPRLIMERAAADNPEWDGTDGAHPAWWRGSDYGYAKGRAVVIAEVRAAVEDQDYPDPLLHPRPIGGTMIRLLVLAFLAAAIVYALTRRKPEPDPYAEPWFA